MNTYILKSGYVKYTSGTKQLVHRAIWEDNYGAIPKGMVIHHINSDKQDNRIENLSMISISQNMQKMDRAGKGYVVRQKKNSVKYEAYRQISGTLKYLGHYGTPCGAYMSSRLAYITNG